MSYTSVLWDLDDDPDGNVQHIHEHGLTCEDVEDVLDDPIGTEVSRTTGLPIAFGWTRTGKLIAVVLDQVDEFTVRPVTAYEIEG